MLNSAIDMWGPEQDRRTEEDEAKRQPPKNTLVTSGAKEVSTPGDMLLVIRERRPLGLTTNSVAETPSHRLTRFLLSMPFAALHTNV